MLGALYISKLANPQSKSAVAVAFLISRVDAAITTQIRVIPFLSAVADIQNFAFEVEPVFNPFAPL